MIWEGMEIKDGNGTNKEMTQNLILDNKVQKSFDDTNKAIVFINDSRNIKTEKNISERGSKSLKRKEKKKVKMGKISIVKKVEKFSLKIKKKIKKNRTNDTSKSKDKYKLKKWNKIK